MTICVQCLSGLPAEKSFPPSWEGAEGTGKTVYFWIDTLKTEEAALASDSFLFGCGTTRLEANQEGCRSRLLTTFHF
jgi:hypothetical protein